MIVFLNIFISEYILCNKLSLPLPSSYLDSYLYILDYLTTLVITQIICCQIG